MRVEDPAGKLNEFADVTDKQRLGKARVDRRFQRVADVVRAFDDPLVADPVPFLQKIRAVVARGEHKTRIAERLSLPDLERDTVDQRVFAHRFDDAACAEDRDATLDAEPRVKRLFRKLYARRDRNQDRQTFHAIAFLCGFFDRAADHLTRDGIDRRLADRLLEPGLRDPSDANAAVDRNARLIRRRNRRIHQYAVCHVRIVAGVLLDRAGRFPADKRRFQHGKIERDPLRRVDTNRFRRSSG